MNTRALIGLAFVVAGGWKLASMWGIVQEGWLWQQPWIAYIAPVLLIYLGGKFVIDGFRHDRDQWLQRPLPINEEGKRICCSVRYGGDEYVYHGEPFHGAYLDAFCGGIRLDLRNALITEDEEIDMRTFIGGIELYVPSNVNVLVKSRSFIGGVSNKSLRNAEETAPCLHIVARNFIGGIEIKN